jgi:hypothetical protein
MREHSRAWRGGIKSPVRRCGTARLLRRACLLVGFVLVPLAFMPGCGGDESQEAGKTTTTDTTTTTETSTLEGGQDLHEENPDGVVTEIEATLEAIRG